MPEPLSSTERRILDYLVEYVRRNTYQPSVREIGRKFGIRSTKTVSEHLQSLAEKGWVERNPSRSRGVRLLHVDLSPGTVTVPWYGGVAPDGAPLNEEAVVREFNLDRDLAGSGRFIIRMRGSTLAADGIHDGDMLLIEPVDEESIESGELVLVRLNAETGVKRFIRRHGDVLLDTAAEGHAPVVVNPGDAFLVVGRVTGLFRDVRADRRTPSSVTAAGDGVQFRR